MWRRHLRQGIWKKAQNEIFRFYKFHYVFIRIPMYIYRGGAAITSAATTAAFSRYGVQRNQFHLQVHGFLVCVTVTSFFWTSMLIVKY